MSNGWRVPRDTVIQISVYSKERRPLSDFGVEEGKFEKRVNKEMPGLVYYFNYDEGIEIEALSTVVGGVTYFPAAKDNYLRCPDPQGKTPGDRASARESNRKARCH